MYHDNCAGLHLDTIDKYYGVFSAERVGPQGVGNPPDEDDVEPDIADRICLTKTPRSSTR